MTAEFRPNTSGDARPATDPALLHHIQHSAFRCRDAEQTRWFYEDILGLPLAAALVVDRNEADGEDVRCMHIFFEMGDGNHIAFFDEPNHARSEHFDKKHGFDLHVAFEASDIENLRAWEQKFRKADIKYSLIDHGFLRSIYCYDPNGIRVEITCKMPSYDGYMKEQQSVARDLIHQWTSKTRTVKDAQFGPGAIDNRSHLTPDLPTLR